MPEEAAQLKLAQFTFHGIDVEVASDDPKVPTALSRDFAYFTATFTKSHNPQVRLRCHKTMLGKCFLPELKASDTSPRYAAYDDANIRWVDYYRGKALVRWDRHSEHGDLWSEDSELLHELAYLLILSRVGAKLDAQGMHRLHAGAIAINGGAVLLVGASGAGKTTLTLSAVMDSSAKLLSDDMPLVSRTGNIAAWPSRLGLVHRPTGVFPEAAIRAFNRRELGLKWLVDIEPLRPSIAAAAKPWVLVVARRQLSGAAAMVKISRWRGLKSLIGPLVLGVGIPQLVEYFLRASWADLAAKIPLVASRLCAAMSLAWRSECYELSCSSDLEANLRIWQAFLRRAQSAASGSVHGHQSDLTLELPDTAPAPQQ